MKRMDPGSCVCYASVLPLSNNPSPSSFLDGRETKEHMWQGLKKSLRNTTCYCIQETKNRQETRLAAAGWNWWDFFYGTQTLFLAYVCSCLYACSCYVSLCIHMCILMHICACVCACCCVCVLMWGAHVYTHKKRCWGSNLYLCCKASTFLTESPPLSPGLWISGPSTTCGVLIL